MSRSGIAHSETKGADELLAVMKGPVFKDANKALRQAAKRIALELVAQTNAVVEQSQAHAPQVAAVVATGQAVADRVPTIAYGRKALRMTDTVRTRGGATRSLPFKHAGESAAQVRKRSNAVAFGIIFGPRGGKRQTSADENYYGIPRSDEGGPVGQALAQAAALHQAAQDAYRDAFNQVLESHGFDMRMG